MKTLRKIQDLTPSLIKAPLEPYSIAAHNFSKIQSLIGYNCIHHFDIICLSETYLNSDILSYNENLDIPGYRLIRSDHSSNDKRGGVCVYFKSSLPIQMLSISMLHECISLEFRIDGKLWNLICLYRSPSQNMEEFGMFVKNLDLNIELIFTKNPCLTVVIGYFNVKSHNWYKGDKTKASGTKLEIMTSHYGLTQIINKPTHILEDAYSCPRFTNERKTCLRLKGSSPTFREKPTLVLHQYFFMAIRFFQLNLTSTYSICLMTTYPQKVLNLLSLQRLDSYLRSSKF